MKFFKSLLLICAALLLLISCTSRQSAELFLIKQNNKWGYIDRSGVIVIKPQFERAEEFYEGLAAVGVDGRWGYIDSSGDFAIKPQFDYGRRFSEGMAVVEVNGRSGYIDKSGQIVIAPQFGRAGIQPPVAGDFYEGLAIIKLGEFPKYTCGYIDKTGKYVINPIYQDASPFSEGLASVKIGNRYGYIDKSGKYILPPQFLGAGSFSEGLATITDCLTVISESEKKYANCTDYYIDRTGNRLINLSQNDYSWTSGNSFHEGLAAVRMQTGGGYIDREGKLVISPQFGQAFRFSEGLAQVQIGGKHGYIDRTGKIVINPQFDMANPFSGGLAQVIVDHKIGYIDKTGKYVWNPTD